jgi:hypothetical protein
VRLAEGQALAHEVVGEVGGGGVVRAGRLAHALRPEGERAQHGREHAEDGLQRVHAVEERLLVLLHVGVVGQRQPLHGGEHRGEVAVEPPRLAAHQLGHVRVLLLRHDRRPRGEGVGELHEAELARRPQGEIGGQAREVHAGQRRRGQELDHVVAVAHRVHAVRGGRAEAEVARERLAIDGEGGTGQRSRAEREAVVAPAAVAEALAVAGQHRHVGQQVVRQEDRLSALHVRVAGHGRGRVLLRAVEQRALELGEPLVDVAQDVAQVESLVEGDLVVARPPRVQLAAHRARQLGEPALHVHVDVLELLAEGEAALGQLGLDAVEPGQQRLELRVRDQLGASQRARPGATALDVVGPEPAVEAERRGEGLRGRVGAGGEAPTPGLRHEVAELAAGAGVAAGAEIASRRSISAMIRRVISTRSPRLGAGAAKRSGAPKRTSTRWRRGR